jgi:hypothetical protein
MVMNTLLSIDSLYHYAHVSCLGTVPAFLTLIPFHHIVCGQIETQK